MKRKEKLKELAFWAVVVGIAWISHDFMAQKVVGETILSNPGMSLGWGMAGWRWLAVVILLVLLIGWWNDLLKLYPGWGLVLGGGMVNLIDRLQTGGVRDYWRLGNSGVHNNLADWLILIGLLIVLYQYLKEFYGKRAKKDKARDNLPG